MPLHRCGPAGFSAKKPTPPEAASATASPAGASTPTSSSSKAGLRTPDVSIPVTCAALPLVNVIAVADPSEDPEGQPEDRGEGRPLTPALSRSSSPRPSPRLTPLRSRTPSPTPSRHSSIRSSPATIPSVPSPLLSPTMPQGSPISSPHRSPSLAASQAGSVRAPSVRSLSAGRLSALGSRPPSIRFVSSRSTRSGIRDPISTPRPSATSAMMTFPPLGSASPPVAGCSRAGSVRSTTSRGSEVAAKSGAFHSPYVASVGHSPEKERCEELGSAYGRGASPTRSQEGSVQSVARSHYSHRSFHSDPAARLAAIPKPNWDDVEVPYFRDFTILLIAILRYTRKISAWNRRRKERKLERRLLREATEVHAHPTSVDLNGGDKGPGRPQTSRVWPPEPTEGRVWRKDGHAGWTAQRYRITPLGWEAMQTVEEERLRREQAQYIGPILDGSTTS